MTTVMTISSIRGGVGKSSLALEIALFLSTKGKVLLIDADFYSPTLLHEINSKKANTSIQPKTFLRNVLGGKDSVKEACVNVLPNFYLIFSDPKVNLWELSKDVGSKNFWSDDNPSKASPTELGMAKLREFVKENAFEYVVFDTMAGLGYPVIFFSYISMYPIFLSRPSLPQVKDVIGFVNLLGVKERPVNVIWSNVPSINNYMEPTRQDLERKINEKCAGLYRSLGFIPRDPSFEKQTLLGTLSLTQGKFGTPYYSELHRIVQKIIS